MSHTLPQHPDIAAIAIGRNEGDRLRRCLNSLRDAVGRIVYVDSGSTDGSVEFARSIGAEVIELDLSRPFSMARARNEGWRSLQMSGLAPKFLLFVDGDCEIVPGWIARARETFGDDETLAVVCGWRRERHPDASRYNRFCDIEWRAPAGEVRACGGDFLARYSAVETSAGMNEELIAGEEPEWCLRLRGMGYRIVRIPEVMTIHDANILRFSQWWRRTKRAGYGGADVFHRVRRAIPGTEREDIPFSHIVDSSRQWTIRFALTCLFGLVGGVAVAATFGGGIAAAVVTGLFFAVFLPVSLGIAQAIRIARSIADRAEDPRHRLAYGLFTVIGKFPQCLGQIRYHRDLRRGRIARLIEYK